MKSKFFWKRIFLGENFGVEDLEEKILLAAKFWEEI